MAKLKVRNLKWFAGRPVVILGGETAKKYNIYVDERVSVQSKNKKAYAVVDIFSKLVNENEVGLSHEISNVLKLKEGSYVDVQNSESFYIGNLLKRKISGQRLSQKEFSLLIKEISNNNITETEIAYFVAAEKIHGLSTKEIYYLTKAMVETGNKINFSQKIIADKHCIGGIAGNRTTPIIVAICAASGLTLPKNSSRAITSASGTADVIETIAKVDFKSNEIKKIVKKTGACLVWGGSLGLAPSDDKIIYVERILNLDVEPQLISSILAKKISAGSNRVLIDIPYGGGKVSSLKRAKQLGKKFKRIARRFHIKVLPVYTPGKQPIGNGIGPVLEMMDVIHVLKNEPSCPKDLREKSLFLAAKLMKLCKIKNPKAKALELLKSGKAYEKFKEIIQEQNGSNNLERKIKNLKPGKYSKTIKANKSGKITIISNKKINMLCRVLGCPEEKKAGVFLHRHLGSIEKSEELITLYAQSEKKLKDAIRYFYEFEPIVIRGF